MQIYSKLRDSLYDSQMNMGLNEMHARYQNDRLRSERDRYRSGIITVAVGSILLLLTLLFSLVAHRKRLVNKALRPDGIRSLSPSLAIRDFPSVVSPHPSRNIMLYSICNLSDCILLIIKMSSTHNYWSFSFSSF